MYIVIFTKHENIPAMSRQGGHWTHERLQYFKILRRITFQMLHNIFYFPIKSLLIRIL